MCSALQIFEELPLLGGRGMSMPLLDVIREHRAIEKEPCFYHLNLLLKIWFLRPFPIRRVGAQSGFPQEIYLHTSIKRIWVATKSLLYFFPKIFRLWVRIIYGDVLVYVFIFYCDRCVYPCLLLLHLVGLYLYQVLMSLK